MEKKRVWKKKNKKKTVFGKKPQRAVDFFLSPRVLLRSHVWEGLGLPLLLFISELTCLNIVLIRKYMGHLFFYYCKCSTLLVKAYEHTF